MFTEAQRLERLRARRQGLRIALAISFGFPLALASGDPLPFLAPLFASQFLLASRRPMALRQGLGLLIVILAMGLLLIALTAWFRERPLVLIPLLWLIYLIGFWLQDSDRGAAAAPLMLIIAVIVPLLDILHPDLGESILLLLAKAVTGGLLLAWASHGLFPDPGGTIADRPPYGAQPQASQVMASASILLGMVVFCLVEERLSTALVVPITVATLLGQLQPAHSQRVIAGLVLVNLLGGLTASLAFTLLSLRPTYWLLFLLLLVVGLLFGGRAALGPAASKACGGALIIFLLLFGLGVSPLPTTTPESFVSRIAYVLFAIVYTLILTTLLSPRSPGRPANQLKATQKIQTEG